MQGRDYSNQLTLELFKNDFEKLRVISNKDEFGGEKRRKEANSKIKNFLGEGKNIQDFLQVFRGSDIEKMEDNNECRPGI